MGSPTAGVGSACGKVILFGEHAVVHGVVAIAAGISRGASAIAELAERDELMLDGKALSPEHPLTFALGRLREALAFPPAHVRLTLDLPAGAGLGASAAMGVATARALVALHKRTVSELDLFAAAQAWERVFHGNPSGVDVAAAQKAWPVRFTRKSEPEPLLLQSPLRIVVAQAGPPASTKEMVENVAQFKARNEQKFSQTLEAIAALVENATLLLRSGDLAAVGKLMDLNQMLLASWMLSTQEIEKSCYLARQAGALGAKLTGAGGGGCVIALAGASDSEASQERADAVSKAWSAAEIPCFVADITGRAPEVRP